MDDCSGRMSDLPRSPPTQSGGNCTYTHYLPLCCHACARTGKHAMEHGLWFTARTRRNPNARWTGRPSVAGTAYHVIVERDEDGLYVGSVPELPGCHTQAKTKAELESRIREAIQAYLSAGELPSPGPEFVEVQTIEV